MRAGSGLLFVALLASSAIAQQGYVERIDVRISNVEVVVTDATGKTVTGLTRDDFELVAGGVRQKIVNFYEATSDPSPASAPAASVAAAPAVEPPKRLPRRMVFFVDNRTLNAPARKRFLERVRTLAAETLSAGDEAMVVTYDGALRVRVPFTDDVETVRAVLGAMADEPGGGNAYRRDALLVQNEILASKAGADGRLRLASNYAEAARRDLEQSAEAIKTVLRTLAGVDGRKVMVLASEGLPIHPGLEMFRFVETLTPRKFGETNIFDGGSGASSAPVGFDAPSEMAAAKFDARDVIQGLAREANAHGVALYPLHGGALAGGDAADVINARSNSLSAVLIDARASSETAMKLMADVTGGRASVGTIHEALFDGIRDDLSSYYSLGFRSDATGYQDIRVRLRKPGKYTVRHRQAVLQKPVEQEVSDRVVANLFTKAQPGDTSIRLAIGAGTPEAGGKMRVPVKISVPYDWLALLEQGGSLRGEFEVYVAVADAGGAVSPVARRTQAVSVSSLEEAKGKVFPYTMQFLMNGDARRVAVAVVDKTTQMTSFASHDFAN